MDSKTEALQMIASTDPATKAAGQAALLAILTSQTSFTKTAYFGKAPQGGWSDADRVA